MAGTIRGGGISTILHKGDICHDWKGLRLRSWSNRGSRRTCLHF